MIVLLAVSAGVGNIERGRGISRDSFQETHMSAKKPVSSMYG